MSKKKIKENRQQKKKRKLERLRERIAAGELPGKQLQRAEAPAKTEMLFSFKHLDFSNEKFTIAQCSDYKEYSENLLTRLKQVCQWTRETFQHPGGNPKAVRSHAIDFPDTTEKNGFSLSQQIWESSAWQFMVGSKTEHGSVHGYLDRNVFYVVWLDPNHNLYD